MEIFNLAHITENADFSQISVIWNRKSNKSHLVPKTFIRNPSRIPTC